MALLPYFGKVIHARWSGEALWSPLSRVLPLDFILPRENPSGRPGPGEILLFAGEQSEPELLIVYGTSRFASEAGPLEGNPVLTIENQLDRVSHLGPQVLWSGAMELRIQSQPQIQLPRAGTPTRMT